MDGGDAAEAGLASLRAEIDRIDAALHALLMERGEIIDRLIAVKAKSGGASAFRPAREAAMMRRLVERHRGILPLATVEGIWRIIISTFTYVQSPYAVHADMGRGASPDDAAAMRDACRYHFGFTVPLTAQGSAAAVVAAVAEARNDLGLLRCGGAATPWWDALRDPDAPKVIARLPFVERADHAAGLPLLVIAKPPANEPPAGPEPAGVALYAAVGDGALPEPFALVDRCGTSLLVAAPNAMPAAAAALASPAPVGSHAAPFAVAQPSRRPVDLLRSLDR